MVPIFLTANDKSGFKEGHLIKSFIAATANERFVKVVDLSYVAVFKKSNKDIYSATLAFSALSYLKNIKFFL